MWTLWPHIGRYDTGYLQFNDVSCLIHRCAIELRVAVVRFNTNVVLCLTTVNRQLTCASNTRHRNNITVNAIIIANFYTCFQEVLCGYCNRNKPRRVHQQSCSIHVYLLQNDWTQASIRSLCELDGGWLPSKKFDVVRATSRERPIDVVLGRRGAFLFRLPKTSNRRRRATSLCRRRDVAVRRGYHTTRRRRG